MSKARPTSTKMERDATLSSSASSASTASGSKSSKSATSAAKIVRAQKPGGEPPVRASLDQENSQRVNLISRFRAASDDTAENPPVYSKRKKVTMTTQEVPEDGDYDRDDEDGWYDQENDVEKRRRSTSGNRKSATNHDYDDDDDDFSKSGEDYDGSIGESIVENPLAASRFRELNQSYKRKKPNSNLLGQHQELRHIFEKTFLYISPKEPLKDAFAELRMVAEQAGSGGHVDSGVFYEVLKGTRIPLLILVSLFPVGERVPLRQNMRVMEDILKSALHEYSPRANVNVCLPSKKLLDMVDKQMGRLFACARQDEETSCWLQGSELVVNSEGKLLFEAEEGIFVLKPFESDKSGELKWRFGVDKSTNNREEKFSRFASFIKVIANIYLNLTPNGDTKRKVEDLLKALTSGDGVSILMFATTIAANVIGFTVALWVSKVYEGRMANNDDKAQLMPYLAPRLTKMWIATVHDIVNRPWVGRNMPLFKLRIEEESEVLKHETFINRINEAMQSQSVEIANVDVGDL